MMSITNGYWIDDKYYNLTGFIPAKDCKFNKENFKQELEKELMTSIELLTDIREGYYRIQKSGFFERSEFGEYCYMPCEKGRGAVLYYFAGIKESD